MDEARGMVERADGEYRRERTGWGSCGRDKFVDIGWNVGGVGGVGGHRGGREQSWAIA